MHTKEDKILRKLKVHDKRFDKVDNRFSDHDKQFVRIVNKLVDHGEELKEIKETMTTKQDLFELQDKVLTGQDQLMQILRKLDQEHHFTLEWIKRIDRTVVNHTKEISGMKRILKIR